MTRPYNGVLRHLRAAAILQAGAATDCQLLERFLSHRDEQAFEALVLRHGPMVWGVCRRALGQVQDAEDAFQATFLVLVRKAGSIRRRELLGNWLYGTAYRVAMKVQAARRRLQAVPLIDVPESPAPPQADVWGELRVLVDRELCRLPEKYRVAVVLCDLQGLTRKEAAQRLAVPEGTLSGRLTNARRLLAKRLGRYGLTISGTALAAALSEGTVPAALVTATTKISLALAAGRTATLSTTGATAIMEGVLKAMLLRKIQTHVVTLLVIAALATVLGLMALPGLTAQQGTDVLGGARTPSPAKADNLPLAKEDPAPQQNQAQGGLAPEVVQAWENGGERFGWIHADEFGRMVLTEKRPSERTALPCFAVLDWPEGGITTLPRPGAAFGLVLGPGLYDDSPPGFKGGPGGANPGAGPGAPGPAGAGDAAGPPGGGKFAGPAGGGKFGGRGMMGPGGGMPGMGGRPGMGWHARLALKRLAALTHLRILVVDQAGWQLDQTDLQELTAIQQLQVLHVPNAFLDQQSLKLICGMVNLESLSLSLGNRPAKGSSWSYGELARLTKLTTLHLAATRLGDQDLKELAALKRLRILDVSQTNVSNTGLKELAQHKQWRALALAGTKITDAGLKELAAFDGLQALDVSDTRVADAGLKELAGLKQLRSLYLADTDVGDDGLKALGDMQELRTLDLSRTWVTDAGLKTLANLRQLRTLRLSATQVTDAGIAALRKALPEIEVER
jgi:RNA polymerase sigma factor (sigma-70 family)